MFRVPNNPDQPTFDDTFKVGFWRWLISSAADRKEWARRRNAAVSTMTTSRYLEGKQAAAQAKADEKRRQRDR